MWKCFHFRCRSSTNPSLDSEALICAKNDARTAAAICFSKNRLSRERITISFLNRGVRFSFKTVWKISSPTPSLCLTREKRCLAQDRLSWSVVSRSTPPFYRLFPLSMTGRFARRLRGVVLLTAQQGENSLSMIDFKKGKKVAVPRKTNEENNEYIKQPKTNKQQPKNPHTYKTTVQQAQFTQ